MNPLLQNYKDLYQKFSLMLHSKAEQKFYWHASGTFELTDTEMLNITIALKEKITKLEEEEQNT